MNPISKAVVTVVGVDCKGIIAQVSGALYHHSVNIMDISQTVLDGYFNMIMIVDIGDTACNYDALADALATLGSTLGLQIRIQKSEIFEAMHHI